MTDIRLEDIRKVYGDDPAAPPAVADVRLHIASGEFFFLLGPSGCGKTTLLRMIAGLIEPTEGKLWFGDRDVTDLPVEKRNTAMVFQNYALWPHMTVAQNVEFGPKMQGLSGDQRRKLAQENLQLVQMDAYLRRKPNQLSGGQQQRVALARALAARPDGLLLDEPLSNLDARLRLHMRSELRQLVKAAGTTAVYVTHDQKEALSMADRIAVMRDGRIIQTGTPEEVYHRPGTKFVADFLGEANFVVGNVQSGPDGPLRIDTPVGQLLAEAGGNTRGNVTCCVRPECVDIRPADTPAAPQTARLRATVTSSTFLGEIRQYLCRLEDQSSWRITALTGSPSFAPDQEVSLHIPADRVALLSE